MFTACLEPVKTVAQLDMKRVDAARDKSTNFFIKVCLNNWNIYECNITFEIFNNQYVYIFNVYTSSLLLYKVDKYCGEWSTLIL